MEGPPPFSGSTSGCSVVFCSQSGIMNLWSSGPLLVEVKDQSPVESNEMETALWMVLGEHLHTDSRPADVPPVGQWEHSSL